MNLSLIPEELSGRYDFPFVRTDIMCQADSLIPFNKAKTNYRKDVGVHFFIDDYQFERVWRSPQLYVEMLRKYSFVCAPDFSLFIDMPLAVKIWNVYRSRLITSYWQQKGLNIVPVLQWADPCTFDFCFFGIETWRNSGGEHIRSRQESPFSTLLEKRHERVYKSTTSENHSFVRYAD